jgi:LmbE family N-acetylglucosaminyl deacetylase
MSRVLVVCAHPDDESVGCGGALLLHARAGDRVDAVFLTSGEGGGHGEDSHGQTREGEAKRAAAILGIEELHFWREPDGRLRAHGELVRRLAALIDETECSLLYAPQPADDHPDHRAAARLVRAALGAAAVRPPVRFFEIWSPLGDVDEIVDISDVIDEKRRAIRAYRSQCAVMRLDDAFVGLARYRGEMHSWPGGPYAEVFAAG